MRHKEINWDSVTPVRQHIDVAGHREELDCDNIVYVAIGKGHYHLHWIVRTNDNLPSHVTRKQTDWNVVDNFVHYFLPFGETQEGFLLNTFVFRNRPGIGYRGITCDQRDAKLAFSVRREYSFHDHGGLPSNCSVEGRCPRCFGRTSRWSITTAGLPCQE